MWKDFFRITKAVLLVFGLLLSFFAVLEVIRAWQTLDSLHPVAGYLFLFIMLAGGIWLAVWFYGVLLSQPSAVNPPHIPDIQQAQVKQLKKWAKYQLRFMQRLSENSLLEEYYTAQIKQGRQALSKTLSQNPHHDALLEAIVSTEKDAITPALECLDRQASRQVSDCVRDVMLGVTLSPYKSADIIIVLYRNIMMTGRIIKIYKSRPTLSQTLRIGLDILNIVATVNYINMGKNLIEAIASRLPGIGKLTDDVVQGIGAGFMTSIAGHAAIGRCRSFRLWNAQEAKAGLLSKVGDFYNDVRDIFFGDIWGFLRARSTLATDQVRDTIRAAIDQTAKTLTQCVRIPAKATIATGQVITKTTTKGAKSITKAILWPFSGKKPKE